MKEDPSAAPIVNKVLIEDVKRITLSGFASVKDTIEQEVLNLSQVIDEKANMLEEKQREGFVKVLGQFKTGTEQRAKILRDLKELTELQERTAARLSAGQSKLLDMGSEILNEASSAARSGRLLVASEFGRLPLSQQVSELENPKSKWRQQLSESFGEDLKSYTDLIKSRKIRQDVANVATNIATGVNAFAEVAKGLGWSIAEHPNFNQTVNVAASLAGAVAGFATMGPMGLIGPISGLIGGFGGGGGPSSGEIQILKKLDVMDEKLDDLLKGQDKILDAVKDSTKKVIIETNKILAKNDQILDELDAIRQELAAISLKLEDYTEFAQDVAACIDLREDISEIDFSHNGHSFIYRFSEFSQKYASALKSVERRFSGNRESKIHSYFNVASLIRVDPENGNLKTSLDNVEKHFQPLVELLWDVLGLNGNWHDDKAALLVASLCEPAQELTRLERRPFEFLSTVDKISDSLAELGNFSGEEALAGLFVQLIDPSRLISSINDLLLVVPLMPLLDPRSDIKNPKILFEERELGKQHENNVRQIFEQASRLLNIAVAQQTLLSGDVILPQLQNFILRSDGNPRIIGALNTNTVLQENVMKYIVLSSLKSSRRLPDRKILGKDLPATSKLATDDEVFRANLYHYHILLDRNKEGRTAIPIEDVLDDWFLILPFELDVDETFDQNGNRIIGIGLSSEGGEKYFFPLPLADQIFAQQLSQTEPHKSLVAARAKLLTLIDLMFPPEFILESRSVWSLPSLDFDYAE